MEYESPRARPRASDFDLIEQLADPRAFEPWQIVSAAEELDLFHRREREAEQARTRRGGDWLAGWLAERAG